MLSLIRIGLKEAISKVVAILIGVAVVIAVGAGYYISTWGPPTTSTPITATTPTSPVTITTTPVSPTTPTTPKPTTPMTPTTTPTTPTSPVTITTTPVSGRNIQFILDLKDLVDLFRYAKWSISDYIISEHELEVSTFAFWDRGDATFGGIDCRVLEVVVVNPSNETINVVMYISKEDWITVVRLIVDGVERPPYPASIFVGMLLAAFFEAIIIPTIYPNPPPEVGYLSYLGSEDITYGAVTLGVDKWRFIPNPQNPDFVNVTKIDVWLARYGEVYLCFYLSLETVGSIHTYAMQEVEFA